MKPLGSITKYWRFVDTPLQTMLESEMESAFNYADFVRRFFDRVLDGDYDDVTVFLACKLGQFAGHEKMEAMARTRPDCILARPYYLKSLLHRTHHVPIESIIESVQEALTLKLDKWIELELQIQLWMSTRQIPEATNLRVESQERIDQLFEENSDLECLKPEFLRAVLQDPQIGQTTDMIDEGLEIAQRFDDQVAVTGLYGIGCWILRNYDVNKAREYFEKEQQGSSRLGYPTNTSGHLNMKAAIHNVCGEFDASIECYHEAIEYRQKQDSFQTRRMIPLNLSMVYHQMENYEDAFEWAKLGSEDPEFISSAGMVKFAVHQRMALALASMGRLDEAEEHWTISHRLALDSADELNLAECQYALGIMEKARGDYQNAMNCLEEAYNYYESINFRNRINYAKRHLAECEVALQSVESSDVVSTQWLDLLEDSARKRNFSGYVGLSLILKAELRAKQGLIEEAKECLLEAVEISKKPETSFLRNKIAALLNRSELSHVFDK